uniref:Uncharacterized protein n=1 Tax=Arcella intermedia TaxID=1963864 RepID=A0A6B2LHH8_9EUKA
MLAHALLWKDIQRVETALQDTPTLETLVVKISMNVIPLAFIVILQGIVSTLKEVIHAEIVVHLTLIMGRGLVAFQFPKMWIVSTVGQFGLSAQWIVTGVLNLVLLLFLYRVMGKESHVHLLKWFPAIPNLVLLLLVAILVLITKLCFIWTKIQMWLAPKHALICILAMLPLLEMKDPSARVPPRIYRVTPSCPYQNAVQFALNTKVL